MSPCNFCADIIAIIIIVSIVLKLSCKQIFLFCQMASYENFKMSDNFNMFHRSLCGFGRRIRGFSTILFKCCVPMSVVFVLFYLLNSWLSGTALLITTLHIMLVLLATFSCKLLQKVFPWMLGFILSRVTYFLLQRVLHHLLRTVLFWATWKSVADSRNKHLGFSSCKKK